MLKFSGPPFFLNLGSFRIFKCKYLGPEQGPEGIMQENNKNLKCAICGKRCTTKTSQNINPLLVTPNSLKYSSQRWHPACATSAKREYSVEIARLRELQAQLEASGERVTRSMAQAVAVPDVGQPSGLKRRRNEALQLDQNVIVYHKLRSEQRAENWGLQVAKMIDVHWLRQQLLVTGFQA
jgi:hypothetical protein